MRRCIIALLCFSLVACGDQSALKTAVRDRLNDPKSVEFGSVIISTTGNRACVSWNAKNGFGGYGGEKIATLVKADQDWQVVDMEAIEESCTENEFTYADAREAAGKDIEGRIANALAGSGKMSSEQAISFAYGSDCADAVSQYKAALGDQAEYQARNTLGDYDEQWHSDLKESGRVLNKLKATIDSGTCKGVPRIGDL